MKKFRKVIPAFILMLISAMLMSTATFAWFSLNTTVTATGFEVEAVSDYTFLLINDGENDTAAEIQAAGLTALNASMTAEAAKVRPAAPILTAAEAAYLPASTGKKVGGNPIETAGAVIEDDTDAAAVTNWYTATAATVNSSAMLAGSAQQLVDFTGYVIVRTVYLTVAAGANAANNLTVTPTITKRDGDTGTSIDAVKVLLVTDDGACVVLSTADNDTPVDIKGDNTNLTDTTVRTVTIYIYYDGNHEDVYTNNLANLAGAVVSLSFNVDAVPAA